MNKRLAISWPRRRMRRVQARQPCKSRTAQVAAYPRDQRPGVSAYPRQRGLNIDNTPSQSTQFMSSVSRTHFSFSLTTICLSRSWFPSQFGTVHRKTKSKSQPTRNKRAPGLRSSEVWTPAARTGQDSTQSPLYARGTCSSSAHCPDVLRITTCTQPLINSSANEQDFLASWLQTTNISIINEYRSKILPICILGCSHRKVGVCHEQES